MIDIDQLQTGDHVELEWASPQGETAKVTGKVWKWSGYQPMVGPFALTGDQFKIISHKPGTPDWAGALVVRDKDGEYWGLDGDRYVCLANDPVVGNRTDAGHLPSAMRQFGPFTVIIDADGNDVRAGYFWDEVQHARGDIADLRAKLDEAEERAEKTRQDYDRLSDQYDEQVGRAERAEERVHAHDKIALGELESADSDVVDLRQGLKRAAETIRAAAPQMPGLGMDRSKAWLYDLADRIEAAGA